MPTLPRLVIASNNPGKLREFTRLFAPLGTQIIPQGDLNIAEAEEPHVTFVENALAKARHAARASGLPALADDSGLCVQVLGGAPGVYSARFAGQPKSDARNNAHLLAQLAGMADRRAYYFAVLVLLHHANDPEPLIASGRLDGQIAEAADGDGGFGYDPLFWVPTLGRTVARLSADEKSAISHRAIALNSLMAQLAAQP